MRGDVAIERKEAEELAIHLEASGDSATDSDVPNSQREKDPNKTKRDESIFKK